MNMENEDILKSIVRPPKVAPEMGAFIRLVVRERKAKLAFIVLNGPQNSVWAKRVAIKSRDLQV